MCTHIFCYNSLLDYYVDLGLYLKMFLEVSAVFASDVTSGPFAGACTQWVHRVHSLRTVYPTTLDIKIKKTENGGKGHVCNIYIQYVIHEINAGISRGANNWTLLIFLFRNCLNVLSAN
jgi:hypothetical protein